MQAASSTAPLFSPTPLFWICANPEVDRNSGEKNIRARTSQTDPQQQIHSWRKPSVREVLRTDSFAPCTFYSLGGSRKLWRSWIEVWIKLYLHGFLTSMSNMGQDWEKMSEIRLGETKTQQSRAAPLSQIQVWEHSNGLCSSQREPFQLPHTHAHIVRSSRTNALLWKNFPVC